MIPKVSTVRRLTEVISRPCLDNGHWVSCSEVTSLTSFLKALVVRLSQSSFETAKIKQKKKLRYKTIWAIEGNISRKLEQMKHPTTVPTTKSLFVVDIA